MLVDPTQNFLDYTETHCLGCTIKHTYSSIFDKIANS